MLREHDRKLRSLLLLTDIAVALGAFTLTISIGWPHLTQPTPVPSPWALLIFAGTVGFTMPLAMRGLRHERSTRIESPSNTLREVLLSGAVGAVAVTTVAFATSLPIHPRPLYTGIAAQILAIGAVRVAMLYSLRTLRRRGRNFRDVIVIGTGPRAQELTETLVRHPEWGLRIVGYVDEGEYLADTRIPSDRIFKLAEFPDLLRDKVIDEVMVACPRSMLSSLGPAVTACSAAGVPFTLMTDLFGDYLPPPRVRRFAAHEALTFAPVHHDNFQLGVKRALDILGALVGLTVAAPVIGIAALLIKATSPGPVFFKQIRCGLYGRRFNMYKLRTMVVNAEEKQAEILHLNEMEGPVFKIERDPRITWLGRWLRAFSIDELPQLWSVLTGEMSLVGPRPPIPAEVAQYETSERRRLSMRPGLTCLWQVSGRNTIGFDEWVKLDIQYIDDWSLWNDAKILLMTVPTVLRGTGS